MNVEELTEEFRETLNEFNHLNEYEIETRKCGSDNFDGVEFNITGEYVPVLELLEVVRSHPRLFVEGAGAESNGPVSLFVVEAEVSPRGHATYQEMKEAGDA